MTRPSAVDISRLAAPHVVETLSFEAIYEAVKTDFLTRWAAARAADPTLPEIDVLDLDTDSLSVAFQAAAFRELLLRARINDAARSVMVAFAIGADLDHLGALFGVARRVLQPATDEAPARMESDARFRRRVQLAPEAYGAAGSEGAYVFHALTAARDVVDATAVQTGPGAVLVTLLGEVDPVPPAATIEAVRAALSADTVRPLTDSVTVRGPRVVETAIAATLTLYPGPSATPILAEARARLAAWLGENRQLGRDLARSAILARLHVAGVQSIALTSPAADVAAAATDVVIVTTVTVRVDGARDE